MKKHFKKLFVSLLTVLLIFTSLSCDDDDTVEELNSEEDFIELLQSKNWIVTVFTYNISCAGESDNDIVEMVQLDYCTQNNSACPACPEDDPDCNPECVEYCGLKFDWLKYDVNFTSSNLVGTHQFRSYDAVFDDTGNLSYAEEDNTVNYNNPWSFDSESQILTTNFGDVYDYFDGQDFLTFPFEIVSSSNNSIVLAGKIIEQGCELTLDITLE